MIILITYYDAERKEQLVSHGLNTETGRVVILPNDPLYYFNFKFHEELNEFILVEGTIDDV